MELRRLRVSLTEAERSAKGASWCAAFDRRDEMRLQAAEARQRERDDARALEERIEQLRRDYQSGTELRDVPVTERLDKDEAGVRVVRVFRADTGELVETRAAMPEDLQTSMPEVAAMTPPKPRMRAV